MSDRAALISAIIDHPNDDTARLVFADWLQENGDPERAEFIRAQVEAATPPDAKRAASKPQKRAAALLKKHEKRWRDAVGLPYGGEYSRGFLTGLQFSNSSFAERVAAVLAVEPITEVRLDLHHSLDDDGAEVTPKWVDGLAANPHLRVVTEINSQTGGFGGKNFARLMKSKHFSHLREIHIFEDVIGSVGVKGIVASPSTFTLHDLVLNTGLDWEGGDEEKRDSVAAVKILATSPRFASLTHLGLPFNTLGDKCVQALLKSKTLPQNLRLGLADNCYDTDKYDELLSARFTLEDY